MFSVFQTIPKTLYTWPVYSRCVRMYCRRMALTLFLQNWLFDRFHVQFLGIFIENDTNRWWMYLTYLLCLRAMPPIPDLIRKGDAVCRKSTGVLLLAMATDVLEYATLYKAMSTKPLGGYSSKPFYFGLTLVSYTYIHKLIYTEETCWWCICSLKRPINHSTREYSRNCEVRKSLLQRFFGQT